jgi:Fur family ferric uptake transcriptional regulator
MAKKTKAPELTLESLLESLKSNGLKLTPPRKIILGTLLKSHGPFSAEEIYKNFAKKTCDLATVYRNLTHLENAKMIRRCDFGDGVARYELIHSDHDHHHHLICKGCKKVEILDLCEMENLLNLYVKKYDFKNVTHILELFGTCPNCQ